MVIVSRGASQVLVWRAEDYPVMSQRLRIFSHGAQLSLQAGREERRYRQVGTGAGIDPRRLQLGIEFQEPLFQGRRQPLAHQAAIEIASLPANGARHGPAELAPDMAVGEAAEEGEIDGAGGRRPLAPAGERNGQAS